jgi:hypothetical protein
MKSKVVKLTLDDLLEVLLSHGIQPKKVEAIVVNLGIPQDRVKKTLANTVMLFSRKEAKKMDNPGKQKFDDLADMMSNVTT